MALPESKSDYSGSKCKRFTILPNNRVGKGYRMYKSHIVLATPAPITNATSEENLGLGYIAAYCQAHGVEVTIIDGWMENLTEEKLVARIIDCGELLLVGFSCYHLNMDIVCRIVELLHKKGFSAPLIAGGFGPTFSPEEFLNSGFDVVSLCEGEETIYKLCQYYNNEITLEEISGICYMKKDGSMQTNQPKHIADIDMLPFPSRDTMHYALKGKTPVDILSSRGCTGNCTFCSVIAFWKKSEGKRYRSRNIISIVDEMERLVEQGAVFLKFVDDSFVDGKRDTQWCREFAQEIKKRGLDIRYRVMMRANAVNAEILEALCQSGLVSIQLGIENFAPSALRRMGKSADLDQNLTAMETVAAFRKRYNLYLQIGFILFDYGTTFDEVEVNFMYLKKYSWAVTRGFTEMYAAADTMYTQNLVAMNAAIPASYGNYNYTIRDEKVRKVYDALKVWHINYLYLYDKTIDPMTKPKALTEEGFHQFHVFYMCIKEVELAYFENVLNLVKASADEQELQTYTATAIEESKDWIEKMNAALDKIYLSQNIWYSAATNPFLTDSKGVK